MLISCSLLLFPPPTSQSGFLISHSVCVSQRQSHSPEDGPRWGWDRRLIRTDKELSKVPFFLLWVPSLGGSERSSFFLRASWICRCLLPIPGLWSSKICKYPLTSGYVIKCYELRKFSSTYLKHSTSVWLNWNPRLGSNLAHLELKIGLPI